MPATHLAGGGICLRAPYAEPGAETACGQVDQGELMKKVGEMW